MSHQAFYKPQPIEPSRSWVARLLRWSLTVSVAGWAAYGLFAFAFADLSVIPAAVQSWMVIVGSALIVIGAESNTVPTCISALSKIGTDRVSGYDYAAFAASIGGTLCSVLITFSSRQAELTGTPWRAFALSIGPLIMGVTTALDFYGAALELALFKRDYEQAMEQWLEERQAWNKAHGIAQEPVIHRVAKVDDFRRVRARLNGDGATLNAEQLESELAQDHLGMPSDSTVKRWLRMAHS